MPRPAHSRLRLALTAIVSLLASLLGSAQGVSIDASPAGRQQVIDGFGTCISSDEGRQSWWTDLYLDTFGASIIRMDLVPVFKAPWSTHGYYSPWFRGRNQQPFSLNFEVGTGQNPRFYTGLPANEFTTQGGTTYYNGPEGNRARTYTSPADYSRSYGGFNAPIAVMGPNIDDNIARCFDVENSQAVTIAAILAAARQRDASLSRFKLIASIWSPAPWLKVSSGNTTSQAYGNWPFASPGTPYPYVATNGNFVGGRLDVSEVPLAVFDDTSLPGDPNGPNAAAPRGPTSALTQFARSTAAWVRAVQNRTGSRFYAISIQNELNFETFYNSLTYPLSSQYILALKYARAEFDKYDDLRDIRIMGPEDLLAGADYALWQFGGGATTVHKNLQYLRNIGQDPEAAAAVDFFCIHGYASDGVSSAGADPVSWTRWASGWTTSPASGIPANVQGFTAFGKKSWMTETSGESTSWGTVSSNGAFSIAAKIHQALTAGRESAWVYWQFTDGSGTSGSTLTDSSQRANATKLNAMRHFSRHIRPGAVRLSTTVATGTTLLASAYLHEEDNALTIVLVNTAASAANTTIQVPSIPSGIASFDAFTSRSGSLWQASTVAVSGGTASVSVPASGIVTLTATGSASTITATPVFSPPPGAYQEPVSVSITSATSGATVHFTTDGSDPTAASPAVSGPVALSASTTLKARAFHPTLDPSAIATGAYTLSFISGATRINAGGPESGTWAADANFTGGSTFQNTTGPIDVSAVTDPAPQLVYQWERYGEMAYGFFNLTPGAPYRLRLHFSENFFQDAGARVFNVAINGIVALANFDIIAAAGARYRAVVREFDAPADASGRITVTFTPGAANNPLVNGLELVAPVTPPGRLANLSTRGDVGTGANLLIAGFSITGQGPKQVLLRALGPQLATALPSSHLPNPTLTLYNQAGTALAVSDNWSSNVNAPEIAAANSTWAGSPLPSGSLDAALLVSLNPGPYTLHVNPAPGSPTGIALAEVFDAEPASTGRRLINLSSRGRVGTGNSVMIAGLVIDPGSPRRVLLRGVGPALAPALPGAFLPDPRLQIYSASGTLLLENDDWGSNLNAADITAAAATYGATPLAAGSADAALLVDLNPGIYTVLVTGDDAGTGIALAEVFEAP